VIGEVGEARHRPFNRRGHSGGVDGFAQLCAAVVARLPFGLARVVAPSLVGFAVINGFTFGVDLAVLSLLHGALGWPLPVAVTGAYALAFALSFVLNRAFNFRSHGPLGRQTAVYALVVAVNFVVMLLGVTTGLAALGVDYRVARVAAGACEGAWMYVAMRWLVFGTGDRMAVQRSSVVPRDGYPPAPGRP
jgi:putative flippase GtrA